MAKNQATTIAIGKNKGHKTTKIQSKSVKPASKKGRIAKRTTLVREIVNQVAGVTGYEKRVIEFLKAGSLKDTKRALKITKKALGTHRRAKNKRENLMNLLRAQQAQQAKKKWFWYHIILYFTTSHLFTFNRFFYYSDSLLRLKIPFFIY